MRKTASVAARLALFLAAAVMVPHGAVNAQSYEQQLKAVCGTLGSRLIAQKKKTAAVVDFTDLSGNVTPLGRFLAEELSACLVGETLDLQVVERLRLSVVLREQKLGESPIINPETAKKLGEIVGAQAIITGTLTPFGDSVRLSTRALDVATARVVGAASTDIPKTRAIEELLTKASDVQKDDGRPTGVTPNAVPGNAVTPASSVAPPSHQQIVRGITWRVMDCQKAVGRIACRVMLTHNHNEEITLQLLRATALDDRNRDGMAYFPLPSNYLRVPSSASEIVRVTFGSGQPGRGSSSHNLAEDASELTSLQLEFSVPRISRERMTVRFQHVPIQ